MLSEYQDDKEFHYVEIVVQKLLWSMRGYFLKLSGKLYSQLSSKYTFCFLYQCHFILEGDQSLFGGKRRGTACDCQCFSSELRKTPTRGRSHSSEKSSTTLRKALNGFGRAWKGKLEPMENLVDTMSKFLPKPK